MTRDDLLEDVAWLSANGESCEQIAKRMGLTLEALAKRLQRFDSPLAPRFLNAVWVARKYKGQSG